MKILRGKYKGRNFYRSANIRPTQNITRQAIFDILGHELAEINFLDLFAGSGAVGLEAISLGAAHITFVEKDQHCIEVIKKNLSILGLKDERQGDIEIIEADALATVKRFALEGRKFDMIFLDPPYGRGLAKKALKTLLAYDIVAANSFVIAEHDDDEVLAKQEGKFCLLRERRYGKSVITIYQNCLRV